MKERNSSAVKRSSLSRFTLTSEVSFVRSEEDAMQRVVFAVAVSLAVLGTSKAAPMAPLQRPSPTSTMLFPAWLNRVGHAVSAKCPVSGQLRKCVAGHLRSQDHYHAPEPRLPRAPYTAALCRVTCHPSSERKGRGLSTRGRTADPPARTDATRVTFKSRCAPSVWRGRAPQPQPPRALRGAAPFPRNAPSPARAPLGGGRRPGLGLGCDSTATITLWHFVARSGYRPPHHERT